MAGLRRPSYVILMDLSNINNIFDKIKRYYIRKDDIEKNVYQVSVCLKPLENYFKITGGPELNHIQDLAEDLCKTIWDCKDRVIKIITEKGIYKKNKFKM